MRIYALCTKVISIYALNYSLFLFVAQFLPLNAFWLQMHQVESGFWLFLESNGNASIGMYLITLAASCRLLIFAFELLFWYSQGILL